ncbi:MAG TPA: MauE/DoxX family redox-associated membrane protein [Nocardioides sp.]
MQWWGIVARLVTGGVWVVAGALKLPDLAASVRAVRAYDLLPEAVVPVVGQLLPIVEVVVGACLLLGLLTRASAVVSTALFLAFVVGIASAWARGLQIDCGCFGGGGQVADATSEYPLEIARDVGLLLLSLWLVVCPRTRLALDNLIFRPVGHPDEGDTTHDAEEVADRAGQGGGPGQA